MKLKFSDSEPAQTRNDVFLNSIWQSQRQLGQQLAKVEADLSNSQRLLLLGSCDFCVESRTVLMQQHSLLLKLSNCLDRLELLALEYRESLRHPSCSVRQRQLAVGILDLSQAVLALQRRVEG